MQIKLVSAIAMGAAVVEGAWAGDAGQSELRAVRVCMSQGGNASVFQAQAVASQIFGRIGVRIDWQPDQRSCHLAGDRIAITLSNDTLAGEHPGEFAYSMPYQGTRIVVFYDRLRTSLTAARVPWVLGHVLAHEIGHVLQGISRHSASGIMKAKWEARDYVEMREKALGFTEYDVSLILGGLDERTLQTSRRASTGAIVAQ
jgi:hypothetical protein